jgi:ribosomal-protein-serine acetyltransferase
VKLPLSSGIELRILTASDADALYALVKRNIAWLAPWMSWAHPGISRADVLANIDRMAKGLQAGTDFHFGIFDGGAQVGSIGLHVQDADDRIARIGYWLDERATGRGLVTSAVRELVAFAFDSLGIHRIEIRCAPENLKSRAIPERLGFTNEGTQRDVLRMADGRFQSLIMYSLLSSERA